MAIFEYVATDATGNSVEGTFEASNDQDARNILAQYNLQPTSLSQQGVAPAPTAVTPAMGLGGENSSASSTAVKKGKKSSKTKKKKKGSLLDIEIGGGPNNEDISVFTRQMSTLIQAGLPLLRSLEVMIKQQEKKPKFKKMLESVAEKVSSGGTLSDGLAMYPKTFDKLYVNMVRAGEAGGVLDLVLTRLAQFQEKSIRTIKKVKSAMIYPSVIMFVAVGIVTLLMMVVVPQFESIFEQMLRGAPLPGPTQIVVDISDLFSSNPILVLGGMAGSIMGVVLLKKTKQGSKGFDWLGLHVPVVRDVVSKSNVSRITRTFGTLLSSGVPILQALQITGDTLTNFFFVKAMTNIHNAVRDGESMAVQMDREPVFPTMVTSMVEIGEETGELPDMLTRIADNFDEDVDNAVAGVTSLIEPVMIVFLAVVVGFIVIALFLPIVSIIENLG
ncbi:type II secretion system F family protein [Opitutales bacterium]|mgnify:CR=1 FL=1|uniref:type II secretion system F family protein n=1 Tax=Candidatus Chordibacter forsetii TaxID=3381758 RepID=UPI0023700025|nr:type II secretion system F family protein [Opitutales bacterium]MDC0646560.1 type II secretion system F family protein [Opitutales bacterium]